MPKLEPPEDRTISTLYVGNLGEKITEQDLRWVTSSFKLANNNTCIRLTVIEATVELTLNGTFISPSKMRMLLKAGVISVH